MSKQISQNVEEILKKLKDYLNIKTDTELANTLNIGVSTVSNWKFRNSINFDVIFKNVKGIDLNWLLYDEKLDKTDKIEHQNILKEVAVEYLPKDEIDGLLNIEIYDVPAYMSETGLVNMEEYPHSTKRLYIEMKIDPEHLKGVRVIGNSMEGSGINSNDYILYRTDDRAYNNRQILANLNGALIVKTFKKENQGIVLYSEYSDKTKPLKICEDDNLNIIGIVVAVISYR